MGDRVSTCYRVVRCNWGVVLLRYLQSVEFFAGFAFVTGEEGVHFLGVLACGSESVYRLIAFLQFLISFQQHLSLTIRRIINN